MKNSLRTLLLIAVASASATAAPVHRSELIFPMESWHNHGSCIVEAPNGDLIVSWFHGSGERTADDVRILGARWRRSTGRWSEPFEMADTPGFPDTNCAMIIDPQERLWLFWPTILANTWESALMNYKISSDFQERAGAPVWEIEKVMFMKPGDAFEQIVREKAAAYLQGIQSSKELTEWEERNDAQAADKLTRRLGWFTRAHPYITREGRMLVGLYSDGFSFSIVSYTDDWGKTWTMSEPIVGGGNIQPSFARKEDGILVAYMRDNGPPPKRVMVSESKDRGATWGPVHDHPVLKNPGAGLELMNLADGRFLVVNNNLEEGRHELSVSISEDEGRSYRWSRLLESGDPARHRFHYPSVVQSRDGLLHCTYSCFVKDPQTGEETKSIKHAVFNIDWVMAGNPL